jgi:hypothetical protein
MGWLCLGLPNTHQQTCNTSQSKKVAHKSVLKIMSLLLSQATPCDRPDRKINFKITRDTPETPA